eukprot:TRINITY_DN2305_c0_g1_i1.p1 TRINITY_DN2305_c0_g1~~TRINITY_DN2305_c0_g1_i1.p1  ORF type:complete len:1192 (-),score=409.72 TRINITY_DN2305_c0_g1_i1:47-3622(-)
MTQASLSIELPKLFFSCGELVKGKVIFTPKADKLVYGIHINFSGHEWCENGALSDVPFQKRWILDGQTTVFGNKASSVRDRNALSMRARTITESQGVIIKAGTYVWPFSFQVPKNIPPSCEYRNGKVKIDYTVSAIVDIPWSRSIKCVQHLRVGIPYFLDPNRIPSPTRVEKSFVFHRAVDGPDSARPHVLKLEGWVDKPVTFSGDKLDVSVRIDNNSGRTVHSIKCKLKQTWTYGSGFWEKFTVFKVKHKDQQFPLQQGKYGINIPMIIPNLVSRPTVQNASLIRCVYHVTLKLSFRMGGDLRARIPIIVASFPPVIKDRTLAKSPGTSKLNTKRKEKRKSKSTPQQEPLRASGPDPNLLNWDAAVPDQMGDYETLAPQFAAATPMQPLAEELHLMGPSLNINDYMMEFVPEEEEEEEAAPITQPNEVFLREMDFNKYVGEMNQNIAELDAGIQWASAGQLDQTMDISNPIAPKTIQSDMKATSTSLNAALGRLESSCTSGNAAGFMDAIKEISFSSTALGVASRMAAMSMSDINNQQTVLQMAKTIPITAQQAAFLAKDALEKGEYVDDEILKVLNQKVKSVNDATSSLLKLVKNIHANSATSVVNLTRVQENLDKALANFVNPFGDSNDLATLKDLEASSQNFASATNRFVIACHGSDKEILQQAEILEQNCAMLMLVAKGISKKYPNISQRILESVKASVLASQKLLEFSKTIAAREHGSPSVSMEKNLNLKSSQILQQSTMVISLIRELTSQIKKQEESVIHQQQMKDQELRDIAAREEQKKEQERLHFQKLVQEQLERERAQKETEERERIRREQIKASLDKAAFETGFVNPVQATSKEANLGVSPTLAVSPTFTDVSAAPIPAPIVASTSASLIPAPIVASTSTSLSFTNGQPSFLDELKGTMTPVYDNAAQNELADAMKSIAQATEKLKSLRPQRSMRLSSEDIYAPIGSIDRVDYKGEVVYATGSLADAVGGLIQCAQVAQLERGATPKEIAEVYHSDPVWAQGLVSASKEVATLVQSIASCAENQKNMDGDMIAALARSIASSTAQLVSAARSKGDPEGQGHKRLLAAAKHVAGAVSELVSKTQEAESVDVLTTPKMSQRRGDVATVSENQNMESEFPSEEDDGLGNLTATKIQELEAAVRIAKLERELNAARSQLKNLRKDRYDTTTPVPITTPTSKTVL